MFASRLTRPSTTAAGRSFPLQAELTVGAVDDPLEHEADRVAEQVLRMRAPDIASPTARPQIRRKCSGSEEQDELKRKTGCDAEHPRFRAAADWLRRSFRTNAVPGEFAPDRAEAQASLYYYYVWTASHALDLLGRPTIDAPAGRVEWAREFATQLVDRQLADGMWRNVAAARKENVIPIADIVALPALALCRKYLVPGSSSVS